MALSLQIINPLLHVRGEAVRGNERSWRPLNKRISGIVPPCYSVLQPRSTSRREASVAHEVLLRQHAVAGHVDCSAVLAEQRTALVETSVQNAGTYAYRTTSPAKFAALALRGYQCRWPGQAGTLTRLTRPPPQPRRGYRISGPSTKRVRRKN
jgi:hypothetical protein